MKNLIRFKQGKASFISWIQKRIKLNLNFLGILTGPTGIGKSWAGIEIAYEIDSGFESRQIAFTFERVMEILNSNWFNKKKWKIILFDEAQVDIDNRTWQSLTNKLFNYLLSTFRHRNVILLFTSPYMDFMDSKSLKLIHCNFEVRGHNQREKKTHIRPKLLQYNSKFKKFYEHSLYVVGKDRGAKKLVNWFVSKPPKHLIIPYEQDKITFTDKLNKEIQEDLEEIRNKKEKRNKKLDDDNPANLTPAELATYKIWLQLNKNTKKTAEFMGKAVRTTQSQIKSAKNKIQDVIGVKIS